MVDYAILGGGRLARHFSEYFRLLEIPHNCWVRDDTSHFNTLDLPDTEERLRATVDGAERVLLLVSDTAIGSLLEKYPFLQEKRLVHCSGALSFPDIAGAHPLMTFAEGFYDLQTYQSVPFMLEAGQSFSELFPGLSNPDFSIRVEDKALYHAMCVMAGNFTQLLWKGVSDRFGARFKLPADTLSPYIRQLASNFIQSPETALTGPLVRDDTETIQGNLKALTGDPLQSLYGAFVSFYHTGDGQNEPRGQAL